MNSLEELPRKSAGWCILVTDLESDEHVKLYGKRADELHYGEETCPRCRTRIDEHGWCGCDTIGGD